MKRPRCSFRLVLVSAVIAQVLIAVVVVWVLGYQGQLSIANNLSSTLRQQTLSHAVDQASQLLSYPILAVDELDAASNVRQAYSSASYLYNYQNDSAYISFLGNICLKYPGTTIAGTATSAGTIIAAILEAYTSPPSLAFIQQDSSTGFNNTAWLLQQGFNQTLTRDELYSNISILGSSTVLIDSLTIGDLYASRLNGSLRSSQFRDPNNSGWYSQCYNTAQQAISNNKPLTGNHVQWIFPSYHSSRNASAMLLPVTLAVCKSHIIQNPDPVLVQASADNALRSGSPLSANLQRTADLVAQAATQGQVLPIVDFVSLVTYDVWAMVQFLKQRLSHYVVEEGAAFLVTSEYYMLASTLGTPDLSLMIYLPDFIFNSTAIDVDPSADEVLFLNSLYTNLQRRRGLWTTTDYNTDTEVIESVGGTRYYLQFSVLEVPGQNFSFILVMYSQKSAYEGDLNHTVLVSSVVAAVVLFTSIVITIILTQLLHHPLGILVDAMQRLAASPSNLHESPSFDRSVISQTISLPSAPAQTRSSSESMTIEMVATESVQFPSSVETLSPRPKSTELQRSLEEWHSIMLQNGASPPAEWSIGATENETTGCAQGKFCMFSEISELQRAFGWLLFHLRNSQAGLETANAAKDSFLRFVFHEVRIPLNALGLGVEEFGAILDKSKESDNQDLRELLGIMTDQVGSVTRILNDVLSFQRLEDKRMELEYQNFNVCKMIKRLLHSFRSELRAKQLNTTLEFASTNNITEPYPDWKEQRTPSYDLCATTTDDVGSVAADRYRLGQVLTNLLSNAIKFSPVASTIKLQVKLCTGGRIDRKGWMEFRISDTGKGISAAGLSMLFQPYSQIQPGAQQQGKGSGLGLNIAKRLVELHGGDIHVRSEVDKGTMFVVVIPLVTSDQLSYSPTTKKGHLQQEEKSVGTLQPRRALVVEDSVPNLKLLCRLLDNLNTTTDQAEDGVQGVNMAKNAVVPYDVIFMDDNMPNLCGVEATQQLRECGINTPIIGVTGHALLSDQERFIRAGAKKVLIKPIKKSELETVLKSL